MSEEQYIKDFPKWVDTNFEGLDKNQLLGAAAILGLSFPRQTLEKTMRERLVQQIKQSGAPAEEEAPKVREIVRNNGVFDPKPDLKNVNSWGGKRMNVLIYRPAQDDDCPQNYCPLSWEGQTRLYGFGHIVSLPWPLFQSLISSVKVRIDQEEIRDTKGVLIEIRNNETVTPRYNYQIAGPTPGTETLPDSELEYWQRQARKHNHFKGMKRRTLQQIRSGLYGPVGNDFYKDLTDEDILFSILTFLWGDDAEELAA